VVTGVADLNSSLDDLNTKMGNAQRQALALAESFKALSIEQANQKLEQTFTSEINKLNQPMDDLRKAQQDRLAYEREYADLIIDKVSPELAEQVLKIKQQTQAQVDKIAASEKMLDELETELTNRKLLTEELQTQLDLWRKLLGAQVDVLMQKGQTAITTAEASASPQGRLTNEVLSIRTELNKLQDPVNQITAGATAIGDAFHESFRKVVTGSISAREALSSFFLSVGQHFVDMASKMIAEYLKMQLIGLAAQFLPNAGPSLGFGGGAPALAPTGITGGLPSIPLGGGRTGFASGGFVNSPTPALVGEAGPEYVIPQSKMSEAMRRYSAGSRGESVVPSYGDGGGDAGEGGGSVEIGYRVTEINSVRYVTEDEFRAGMAQAAKQGAAGGHRRVFQDLKHSRSQRARIGVG
jgi:hypothetical protein